MDPFGLCPDKNTNRNLIASTNYRFSDLEERLKAGGYAGKYNVLPSAFYNPTANKNSKKSATNSSSGLRAPDYTSIDFGAGWHQYGGAIQFTEDRYGNFYFSYGRSWGQRRFSLSGGVDYILQSEYPSEKNCKDFITGQSIQTNLNAGLGISSTKSITSGKESVGVNIASPSANVTIYNTHYLGNIRKTAVNAWNYVEKAWKNIFK